MLRLSTLGNSRFVQANNLLVGFAGSEANVAVSLANYGHDVSFVTKLPTNDIAQLAINEMRKFGVNTRYISRGGDRIGILYSETGTSIRPTRILYDRSGSSISKAKETDFNFDEIMNNADWFHWSGITPAISNEAAKIVEVACIEAKKRGMLISCDLNYRKALWSSEKATSIMKPLMRYVDICIGNEEDIEYCLGYKLHSKPQYGVIDIDEYKRIFTILKKEFKFKYVVTSLRESISATHNVWKAMIYNGEEFYVSRNYDVDYIVDRIGSGDSFAAGIIHGLLTNNNQQNKALDFAVAASALKHTIPGDFNLVQEDEVNSIIDGNIQGRVQR